jgi:two-component system, sensor histidine kinase and response regulator
VPIFSGTGNILVVDDKLENLKIIESTLVESSYEVRKAINGSMALMGAIAYPPDLILLDIKLPDMDGYQVCQQLKANPKTCHIPVIFLSALDDVLDKVKAFAVGGIDYITKPFQTEELLARIQNQLQICHLQQQLQSQNKHLEKLNQELVCSNEQLEQFAYIVSHDLKQPLQVILGYGKLLVKNQQNTLNTQLIPGLTQIVKSGIHMQQLIDDLLAFSQIGTQHLNLKPIDCNLVLSEILANIQIAIAEAQATINYDSLPTITADETQLAELLQNLICNGIKFHRADIFPEVNILAKQKEDEWLFEIRDNGIGIDPEQFEYIFQMFQRLHSRQEYPGTGIGLATCKKIVEHHGGKIWVESQPDRGASFFFTIPA